MSDELPPSPPGITLMSLQDFLGRRAAPAETPKADAVAIGERNAWEAKFNAECEKHDATTLRAMKAERELALALDHIEKDDKEIERLHNEIAVLRNIISE